MESALSEPFGYTICTLRFILVVFYYKKICLVDSKTYCIYFLSEYKRHTHTHARAHTHTHNVFYS